MSVQVNIKEAYKTCGYPKVRVKGSGEVVLFITPTSGTIIGYTENLHKIENVGFYSNSWVFDEFTDFNGSITLENSYD